MAHTHTCADCGATIRCNGSRESNDGEPPYWCEYDAGGKWFCDECASVREDDDWDEHDEADHRADLAYHDERKG